MRRREAAILVVWVALAYRLANPRLLGLPINLYLSNEALAIALFLPIAVLDGLLVSTALRLLRSERWPDLARAVLVVPLAIAGIAGASNLAGIVNPVCLLASSADVEALRWVKENTPPTASFLINSRRWNREVHAGTDGGYWLPALAERKASLPPLGYDQAPPSEIASIQHLAQLVESDPPKSAAELLPVLLADGITHVFIGSLGGPLHRETFLNTPGYRLVFDNGRASVFELYSPAASGSP